MGDIIEAAARHAAEDPDALLYSFLDVRGEEIERLTRAQFLNRVDVLAGHLAALPGAGAGERILLCFPPGLEMICAFFACVQAGMIAVPAPGPSRAGQAMGLDRLKRIAKDCAPIAVLTNREGARLVGDQGAPSGGPLDWFATDELVEPCGRAWAPRRSPVVFLQYTSGSTTEPRGVMVSHDNLIANARIGVDHTHPVGVCWLPHHHDMGLIGYYINAAILGGRLYAFSPTTFVQRPALWLQTVSRRRATVTAAPNFALEHCLRRGGLGQGEALDLGSLKCLMVAAEPVKPDVYRRFLQACAPLGLDPEALMVAYGLAENTLAVSSHGRKTLSVNRRALARGRAEPTSRVADVSAARHLMSCGRPLGDNQVRIVDPKARRLLAAGEVGEIWVAGQSKCLGYWNAPGASRRTFEAELAGRGKGPPSGGYLRTGDLGFVMEGELYVCGRRKDVIIVRGQNIYPQDIEAVVERACEGVRPGGVAAFESGGTADGHITVLAEVASAKSLPQPAPIAAAIRRELGVAVDEIRFVPPKSLPKTSSGKIRRFLARRMAADGRITALQRFEPGAGADGAEPPLVDGPFAEIRRRHGLSGGEPVSMADAGVDSLDLVLALHELSALAVAAGDEDLAADLDLDLVQSCSFAELTELALGLSADPAAALVRLRAVVGERRLDRVAHERRMMQADRRLDLPVTAAPLAQLASPPGRILLTGGTGFLGPFLLASLLSQTTARIEVLVRAADPDEARARLRASLQSLGPSSPGLREAFEDRVVALAGDLEAPGLGLGEGDWARLAEEADAILHNGAVVNYIFSYTRMRAANVLGTREIVRLAFERRRKVLNYVSTTFVFGWSRQHLLSECDENTGMQALDFGYSQSKWVAEQLVLEAGRRGLATRIFRPALITPSVRGDGSNCDITLRLLAFMIKHGIGARTQNQVSFVPADVIADNIVALANRDETLGRTFHMTRDRYAGMAEVLESISRLTGRRFELFELKSFVPEVIGRCTREDPLYPLLDFLDRSIENISAMQFKRYDNTGYRRARAASPGCRPDPSLDDTIAGILRYLSRTGLADPGLATSRQVAG